jgi:hypothetical protein
MRVQEQVVAGGKALASRGHGDTRGRIGLRGWSYIVYIVVFSLLPSSMNPRIKIPPFYSSVLSFAFVLVGLVAFFGSFLSPFRFHRQWAFLTLVLLAIGAAGTVTNTKASGFSDWLVLIWPMFILVAAPSLVRWVITGTKVRVVRLRRAIATVMTAIAVVYALATVIAPRLGFRGGNAVSFGAARLEGPIGNAAVIYVILLPTLGFWVTRIREGSTRGWLGIGSCLLALILTFSRAAILSLCLWLIWIFSFDRHLSLAKKVAIAGVILILVFGISSRLSSELTSRLRTLESVPRFQSYTAGWQAFSDSPVYGHGFSHLWPWWRRQGELASGLLAGLQEGRFASTPYGRTLWNPHSLLTLFGAETGIFGVAVVSLFFGLPLLRSGRMRGNRELFSALLIVVVLDSLLAGSFYAFPELSSVWWFYLVSIALEGVAPLSEPLFEEQRG